VKDEQMEETEPEEDEWPWWVKEHELQNMARHPRRSRGHVRPPPRVGEVLLQGLADGRWPRPGLPHGRRRTSATSSTSPRTTTR
jgi:hypothetical protein